MRYYKRHNSKLNEGGYKVKIEKDEKSRNTGSWYKNLTKELEKLFNFKNIPVKFGIGIGIPTTWYDINLNNNNDSKYRGDLVGRALEAYFIDIYDKNINSINLAINKDRISINNKMRQELKDSSKNDIYDNIDYVPLDSSIRIEIKTSHIRGRYKEIELSEKQFKELKNYDLVAVIFYNEETPNSSIYIKPEDFKIYSGGYIRHLWNTQPHRNSNK